MTRTKTVTKAAEATPAAATPRIATLRTAIATSRAKTNPTTATETNAIPPIDKLTMGDVRTATTKHATVVAQTTTAVARDATTSEGAPRTTIATAMTHGATEAPRVAWAHPGSPETVPAATHPTASPPSS